MSHMHLKRRIHGHLLKELKKSSRKGLYEFLNAECSALPNGIQVLNVGAGGEVEGIIRTHADNKNWTCVSLDIDPKRAPDVEGSIESFDVDSDSYGAIFLIEVLEHVQQPQMALANILRILKPGGRLIMSTPYLFPVHDAPFDYYRYTEHGLHLLLRAFVNVDVVARNGYFESINVQAMRVLVSSKGFTIAGITIAIFSIYFMRYIALLVDRALSFELGTTGYTGTAMKRE